MLCKLMLWIVIIDLEAAIGWTQHLLHHQQQPCAHVPPSPHQVSHPLTFYAFMCPFMASMVCVLIHNSHHFLVHNPVVSHLRTIDGVMSCHLNVSYI